MYIFKLKKVKQKIATTKAKETKEEKKIYVENLTGYNDIVFKFVLRTFNLFGRAANFSWLFI